MGLARPGKLARRLTSDYTNQTPVEASMPDRGEPQNQADRAVEAFIRIVDELEHLNSGESLWFNKEEIMQLENIRKQLPNFNVRMGFGLNFGWAIEGAIGSVYKIDASYLSLHVNLSARLEAATKQYGVNILLSGSVYMLLSDSYKQVMRFIDRVTVVGSKFPVDLYTFDEHVWGVTADESRAFGGFVANPLLQEFDDDDDGDGRSRQSSGSASNALVAIRIKHYLRSFEEGVRAYVAGDWTIAREKLSACNRDCPNDKPAQVLLNYMTDFDFKAPSSWKGYRALLSK